MSEQWRTEPKISGERQQFLEERLRVQPDIEKGVYPFKDIRLNRADVEWLLETHEHERGPVDWSDVTQRQRVGLDLRGAVLVGANLSKLPLACLLGGAKVEDDWRKDEARIRKQGAAEKDTLITAAAVHLEGADLSGAHLEGAELQGAHLERAILWQAHLQRAHLDYARFEGASLERAHLEGAQIVRTAFQARKLTENEQELFKGFPEEVAERWLPNAEIFKPADLGETYCDSETRFAYPVLAPEKGRETYGSALLADTHWSGANITIIDWKDVTRLGNESIAKGRYDHLGRKMDHDARQRALIRSVRAYRQIAVMLRSQGVIPECDTFAYRVRVLERRVLRIQREWGKAIGSWFLDLISGYGYKPIRSLIAYLIVILGFTSAYFAITNFALTPYLTSQSSQLSWYEALVLSISSFHGRGFFPTGLNLSDPVALFAAFEAIIGLLIEIIFIATFTQRFFAR